MAAIIIPIFGTGIFLTTYTRFITITKFGYVIKETFFKRCSRRINWAREKLRPLKAVSTALAATVGTGKYRRCGYGNCNRRPGSRIWMWIAATFRNGNEIWGSRVAVYQIQRRKTEDGRFVGGPMYYLSKGANMKWLAVLFAIFGTLATFGIGNMVQSNSVADSLNATFGISPLLTGIVLAVLVALVILGGIKSIGKVTEVIVPFMAAIYLIGGLSIILLNIQLVPEAFRIIFHDAFTGSAAAGGFVGSSIMLSIRYGVARGVFTNEAGLGSAPIAHAAATTDHPVRQGLWGIFEVFADTIVLCTITALVIVMTGAWDTGLDGAPLTTAAFEEGFAYGGYIVTFGLIFCAFSTLLGWSYYGERCMEYLFGAKSIIIYRIVYLPLIVVGAVGGLRVVWDLADTLNGLMALPNLVGLLILSPVIVKSTKEYFGKDGIYEKEKNKIE